MQHHHDENAPYWLIKNVFDAVLAGDCASEQGALDYARGMVWCEVEATESRVNHCNLLEIIEGVGVYYNYAADYYFFTDETGE